MSLFDKQEITNLTTISSIVIQAGGDVGVDAELLEALVCSKSNVKLLSRLIADKLQYCNEQIMTKNIVELKKTLSTFLNYGLNGIEDEYKKVIRYYQFLLAIFEKNDDSVEELMDLLEEKYSIRAQKIISFRNNPIEINVKEWILLEPEEQVLILDIMYDNAMYGNIIALYDSCVHDKYQLNEALKYYAALSAYNMCEYEVSLNILTKISGHYKEEKIRHIIVLVEAEIEIAKCKYHVEETVSDKFKEIMIYLEKMKKESPELLHGTELMVALIEVRITLLINKDEFLRVFSSIDVKIQEKPLFQYYLGYYYEMCNELHKATEVYLNTTWKEDINIFSRLLFCFLLLEDYDSVRNCYEYSALSCKVPKTTSMYLTAIKFIDQDLYKKLLQKNVEDSPNDVESLYYLSLAIQDDKALYDALVFDKLNNLLEEILYLESHMIVEIALNLLAYEHADICLYLLKHVNDINACSKEILYAFYKNLYMYKRELIHVCGDNFPTKEISDAVKIKIKIANWFLEKELGKELFLRIVIECYQVLGMETSLLKSMESLYECTHNEMDAVNIIAYISQKSGYEEKYSYYIEEMKTTLNSKVLLAIAVAYHRMGNSDMAEHYAYRALFFLKDDEDFDIYNSYLALMNNMIYDRKNHVIDLDSVVDNSVIRAVSDDRTIYICLDKELELESHVHENASMGVKHFCTKDRLYLMLRNKKKGDVFSWENLEYEIAEITTREVFAYRYVLGKCMNNPEKSQVYTISMAEEDVNVDNVWKQMQEALSKYRTRNGASKSTTKEETVELLDQYHFVDNELGLPIEVICHGDYSKYIEVIRLLLYAKDEALYAGTVDSDSVTDKNFIISLSTLIILCVMGQEELLIKYKDKIMIPTSLTEFVCVQVKNITEMQAISLGTLMELEDGSPVMLPFDDSIVDIWSRAYELCLLFSQIEVASEERENVDVVEGVSAELLFSMFKLDKSQLDCLLLARKTEEAIFMCDDLFYRKIASALGVHNSNFTSLLFLLEDRSEAVNGCLNLSKTNYLYVPFMFENSEQMRNLFQNLLEGERKRQYYRPMIDKLISNAWAAIFGE